MKINVDDIPENKFSRKNQINYDDILKNMGMREVKGKLYWEKNETISSENYVPYEPNQRKQMQRQRQKQQPISDKHLQPPTTYENSYIYNKYFKNEFKEQPEVQQPRNLIEYRNMLIRQIIERKRIEQLKPRQMFFR
jgi:hypothetical protein